MVPGETQISLKTGSLSNVQQDWEGCCAATPVVEQGNHLRVNTNRSRLLEFAGRAITSSRCFNTLHMERTGISVSDGAQFLKALVDSECNQLTAITINEEFNWFEGTEECMGPLLTFLAKQTGLQTLIMSGNDLSDAQQDQIRQAVTDSAPDCAIKQLR